MKKKNPIKKFIKDEKGQGMTEYGLILGVIGALALGAFTIFGEGFKEKIGDITTNLFGE
jgi:pilus assembly protein Flp/PilA